MRLVLIGHSYFNPMRIDRIRADVETEAGMFTPIVKVYLQGKTFHFNGDDLGMRSYWYAEELDARTRADTMLHKVLNAIHEALEDT